MSYQQPKLRRWPWETDSEYEERRSHLTLRRWLAPRLATAFVCVVEFLILAFSPIPFLATGIFVASLLFAALVVLGMSALMDDF